MTCPTPLTLHTGGNIWRTLSGIVTYYRVCIYNFLIKNSPTLHYPLLRVLNNRFLTCDVL